MLKSEVFAFFSNSKETIITILILIKSCQISRKKTTSGLLYPAVESLSLEIFKNCLHAILCNVLQDDPAGVGRLDQIISSGAFQPDPFCDSVICVHMCLPLHVNTHIHSHLKSLEADFSKMRTRQKPGSGIGLSNHARSCKSTQPAEAKLYESLFLPNCNGVVMHPQSSIRRGHV